MWRSMGLALTVLAGMCAASQAQTAAGCNAGFIPPPGLPLGTVPYRAEVKVTFKQELPAGLEIEESATDFVARDGAGRTYEKRTEICEQMDNGQTAFRYTVRVKDPVAKTETTWEEGGHAGKDAFVHSMAPSAAAGLDRAPLRMALGGAEMKNENLGTQSIGGVETKGFRITRTIAAGARGNNIAFQELSEQWRSLKGDILVRSLHDVPNLGRTEVELQNIVLGEPDAAMFAPPSGYAIKTDAPLVSTQK